MKPLWMHGVPLVGGGDKYVAVGAIDQMLKEIFTKPILAEMGRSSLFCPGVLVDQHGEVILPTPDPKPEPTPLLEAGKFIELKHMFHTSRARSN